MSDSSEDRRSPPDGSLGTARERTEPGAFAPGTVLGLLEGFGINRHDVLHRVHQLVRDAAGDPPLPPHGTARITFRDLAGIIEAFRILIAMDTAPTPRGRFGTAKLARDLLALRRLNFTNPLLQAHLTYDGDALAVVARAGDGHFEATGQLFLAETASRAPQFMRVVYGRLDAWLTARLRSEYDRVGPPELGTFEDRFVDPT